MGVGHTITMANCACSPMTSLSLPHRNKSKDREKGSTEEVKSSNCKSFLLLSWPTSCCDSGRGKGVGFLRVTAEPWFAGSASSLCPCLLGAEVFSSCTETS